MDDAMAILDEVKPCLANWKVVPKSITLASHSENIVYKVTAQDDVQYALRVHRPGYHTLSELNSEQTWTAALADFGIKVPGAHVTDSGEYYIATECGGAIRFLGLIEWLDGKPLAGTLPANQATKFPLTYATQMGVICASMHNQASDWQAPAGFARHSLNLEGFVGEQPFWGRFWEAPCLTSAEQKTLKGLRRLVGERLEAYRQPASTYSMIHADLHQNNLFVTNTGLMVIDFDDAGFGWHQYDLAVALFAYTERSDYDDIYAKVIEGYLSQRVMSNQDLSMIPLFMLVRALAIIGWASARPELDRGDHLQHLVHKACSFPLGSL